MGKKEEKSEGEVVIVVMGAPGTGKSSLIHTAVKGAFPESAPSTLPPQRIPAAKLPDGVDAVLVDTASGVQNHSKTVDWCRQADVIVLVYAVNKPQSLLFLRSELLPSLRHNRISLPMILVGTMQDQEPQGSLALEPEIVPIMNEFREIETWLECSARKLLQVTEVVLYAQRAVLHPTGPMFDTHTQQLTPRCVAALRRIFRLCDRDQDGVLSDEELNHFQVACFNTPLQPEEIAGVKKVVMEKLASGLESDGLTLTGFLFLHALFIERGRIETTWTVLRKFGYDNTLMLRPALLQVVLPRHPDQVVELSPAAATFVRDLFRSFDRSADQTLTVEDVAEMFSTAPYNPWEADPWRSCAETRGGAGAVTLAGYLSRWSLMARMDPESALAFLLYLGFEGEAATAFKVSARRATERQGGPPRCSAVKCLVLGAPGGGKSALLRHLIDLPYTAEPAPASVTAQQLTHQGRTVTFSLHEVASMSGEKTGQSWHAELASADVALFVYDSASHSSLDHTLAQLNKIAETQSGVPCVLVAAKEDLVGESDQAASQLLARKARLGAQELCLPPPTAVSVKMGRTGSLYEHLMQVAASPEGHIPETPSMREAKQQQAALAKTYTYIAMGAAVGLVAILVYKFTRKASG